MAVSVFVTWYWSHVSTCVGRSRLISAGRILARSTSSSELILDRAKTSLWLQGFAMQKFTAKTSNLPNTSECKREL